jgi:predicted RNase H-like HicB family nuclease
MQRTVTYAVVITKHPKGFVATCLAFPNCVTLGRSRAGAYKAIKDLIRRHLTTLAEEHRPVPPDPVVSVKHLRLDLLEIHREVDLR